MDHRPRARRAQLEEIGAGGIDVVTDGTNLWAIPDAALRVSGTGAVTSRVTPTRQFHADGVAATGGALRLFDAVAGLLVRLPA